MRKYIYVVLTLFITPLISFASWWNPLSWFEKTVVPPASIDIPTVSESNVEIKVEPKIVTKTITVSDPKLQEQINLLIKSNSDLQDKYIALTTKYNYLIGENKTLRDQLNFSNTSITTNSTVTLIEPKELVVNSIASTNVNTRNIEITNNSNETLEIKSLFVYPILLNNYSSGTTHNFITANAYIYKDGQPNLASKPQAILASDLVIEKVEIPIENPYNLLPRESIKIIITGSNIGRLIGIHEIDNLKVKIIGLPIFLNIVNM